MEVDNQMESITIEQIIIPYNRELLSRWKQKDPEVVPHFMMNVKGPGISNGYSFGEWMAERYLRNQGYYIFSNDFDFISKKTKFERFNKMIETMFSEEQLSDFKTNANINSQNGYSVENIDLFVYDLENHFFAEVKKGKDKLREQQMRFMYLAKKHLGIESKLIYLCDKTTDITKEEITFNFEIET